MGYQRRVHGAFFSCGEGETMKKIFSTQTISWEDNVLDVSANTRTVVVKGPRGELTRSFKSMSVDIFVNKAKKTVTVQMWFTQGRQAAAIRTVCSHIRNMMLGVTLGFRYKMRFVYAHFPVNVNISDDNKVIEIRNFLGEKVIRRVEMLEGVTVNRSDDVKDEIFLVGNNVENVGTSAAQIQQSTKVKNKDIRKFLDGIYVSESGVIPVDA